MLMPAASCSLPWLRLKLILVLSNIATIARQFVTTPLTPPARQFSRIPASVTGFRGAGEKFKTSQGASAAWRLEKRPIESSPIQTVTMPEIAIHQGDDGVEDSQSLPSSLEGDIDSDEEERSIEPQADEDVRNSGGLRNRKIKSSRPEEDVRDPGSELGNDKEKSSRPGRDQDGGVTPALPQFSIEKVYHCVIVEALAVRLARVGIRSVLALLLFLCSLSFSGELYVNQHEDSKDLHQKISEMRIVETPLHSFRSVAQDGTWVFKLARHDFLLLRTAGDKWYKAEKHGPSSGQAGIHFYPVTGPGVETIRFQSSISVDFSLAQALDILTDHELAYNLWGDNCWKYAHSRAEAILNSCIEIASDDNVRNELKKELENLMDARRRMPNEVVDIVPNWNILRGVLLCFAGVFGRFGLGFGKDLARRPSFCYELGGIYSMWIVLVFVPDPNPILLTYNLTWLATTYRRHFNFLSLVGYYVGWTVFLRGVESWFLHVEKLFEDPFVTTAAASGRGDPLDIPILRPNYHQDNSLEDQRKKWPSRTLVFGSVILFGVMTFEQTLAGYSIDIVYLRFLVGGGLFATKRALHG